MLMENVIVTRYYSPPCPVMLNGVLYDFWLDTESGEKKWWDGNRWVSVIKQKESLPCLEDGKTFSKFSIEAEENSPYP